MSIDWKLEAEKAKMKERVKRSFPTPHVPDVFASVRRERDASHRS